MWEAFVLLCWISIKTCQILPLPEQVVFSTEELCLDMANWFRDEITEAIERQKKHGTVSNIPDSMQPVCKNVGENTK